MDDIYKRLNQDTGKPFHEGYQDENGRYFISFINVDDYQTAKNLCNEIKLNKLDCLIKTS